MNRLSAALLAASLASCGGTDAAQPLTADEVAALSATLGNAAAGATSASPTRPARDSISVPTAVNASVTCPKSGHVRTTGNLFVSCPNPYTPGSCTVSGMMNIRFGDPVNNLDDCTYSTGFVVDGGVNLLITGTDLAMKLTLIGSLEIARKGPTGGLIPLDNCFINLVANTPANTLTGSVCGQSVNTRL